ncbi:MAG: RHS repeat protein [Chlamydiia bacterium]|nr:RHS repeat protein [Chlamydiia bacterium]
MKIGFILLFAAHVFSAHPLIEDTEPEPLAVVANCVNVITGNCRRVYPDLVVNGAQPIILHRSQFSELFGYASAVMLKGSNTIQLRDVNGTFLSFVPKGARKFVLSADVVKRGYCNTSRGPICAKHDITNTYIEIEDHLTGFFLHASDGTVRYYRGIGKDQSQNERFLIEREKHQNGHFTHYEYCFPIKKSRGTFQRASHYPQTSGLKRIYTTDSKYERTYAWLNIDYTDSGFAITASDGKSFMLPEEPESPIESVTFHHEPEQNICQVFDSTGAYRIFHYTQERRLCKIEHFTREGKLLKSDTLKWKGHRLQKKELLDENGTCLKKHIYMYDSFGNAVEEHIFTDAGHAIIERSYSVDGLHLLSETTPSGLTTIYEYLADTDLPVATYKCDDTKILRRHFWIYDKDRVLIEEIEDDGTSLDPNDAEDVQVRKVYKPGENSVEPLYPSVPQKGDRYDLAGRVVQHTDQEGVVTTYTYDALDRILTKNRAGALDTYTYNGFACISHTDPKNHTTHYEYDRAGKLIAKRCGDHLTTYTYDPDGRLTSVQASDSTLHLTYTYDRLGRLITARDEIAETATTRTFDHRGNLISETLANGYTISSAYDSENNRIELTYPDHSRVLYTYSGTNLKTVTYLDSSGQPVISHTYDDAVMPAHSADSGLDPQAKGSYDALGRLIRLTKNGSTYIYTYDALHRCIQCNNISYYYDGQNKIGSSANEKRILGRDGDTIAIIHSNELYTPPIPTSILEPWGR